MKKIGQLVLLLIVIVAIGVSVLVAETEVFANQIDLSGNEVLTPTDGKYTVSFDNAIEGNQYILLVVNGELDDGTNLTLSDDNINYIDQKEATSNVVSFTFIPRNTENSTVFLTGTDLSNIIVLGYLRGSDDDMSFCKAFEVSEIADGQFIITVNGQAIGIENSVVVFTKIAEEADLPTLGDDYLWNIAQIENGWTIQNVNGHYLAINGNNVVLSDSPFDWKYNKGRFYTIIKTKSLFFKTSKKYYLICDGSMLALSSKASRSTISLYSISDNGAHEYTAVVTAPTCTEQGYTTHTCSKCGYSYQGNFVEKLGHDYKKVETEPNCTEQGYTTYTCTRCEDSYQDDFVDTLGHVDDNKDGVCDRCEKSMKDSEVIAFANVTKETKIHGWWIFKWTSTTYTANIKVSAENAEVEYSLNNGISWKQSDQFVTKKDPGNFLIRVTDSNGDVTNWQYDSASGATVQMEG